MYIIDSIENLEDGSRTLPFGIICHPKTGTQSTREALKLEHKARCVCGQHSYDLQEVERIKNEGGILVCVVRNPWESMISWYFYSEVGSKKARGLKPTPFLEWLPHILEAGNGWIEKGLFYADHLCNRLIRYEYGLEQQLNQCLLDCGLSPVELPHIAKADRKHYSHYYDIKAATRVAVAFHKEITEYGYQFEYGDDVPNQYYHHPGHEIGG